MRCIPSFTRMHLLFDPHLQNVQATLTKLPLPWNTIIQHHPLPRALLHNRYLRVRSIRAPRRPRGGCVRVHSQLTISPHLEGSGRPDGYTVYVAVLKHRFVNIYTKWLLSQVSLVPQRIKFAYGPNESFFERQACYMNLTPQFRTWKSRIPVDMPTLFLL
ncbi:hypothetical protein BC629DRAFT_1117137 [Irpex lacteus]|nr:hypothetical protein BC629DRAFT_1117137 [Irpex lacteus]